MADNVLKGLVQFEVAGVPELKKAAGGVDLLANRMKAARGVGQSFNQVLREAPAFAFSFNTGLVGISNNLPIFTDAIKRAREAGAGFKTIFSSLAASLFSLPSILSIGVLALTQMSGASSKAKEDTEQLSLAAQEAKQKQDEFKTALDKASSSVLNQASNISDLRNILASTSSEVQSLTDNLINQAVTQFLFDKKNVEVQKILNAEIQKRLDLAKQKSPILTLPSFNIDRGKTPLQKQIADSQDELRILNETAKAIGVTFENIFKPKPVKEINVPVDKVKIKPLKPVIFDFDLTPPDQPKLTEFADAFASDLNKYFNQRVTTDFSLLTAIGPKVKTDAQALGQQFGSILSAGFQDSFSAVGEGIGNVLSGQSFGSGLTDALGSLLSQLGKALIQFGIVKEGLDKLFGPGGILIPGAVAIGLGVLAIAAGKAISNFGGGRATGGPVGSGQSYLVGENGPEIFRPGTTGSIIPNGNLGSFGGGGLSGMMGRVVFEISANKLIGVMANGNRSQAILV